MSMTSQDYESMSCVKNSGVISHPWKICIVNVLADDFDLFNIVHILFANDPFGNIQNRRWFHSTIYGKVIDTKIAEINPARS